MKNIFNNQNNLKIDLEIMILNIFYKIFDY
jgi:hypothetical protein